MINIFESHKIKITQQNNIIEKKKIQVRQSRYFIFPYSIFLRVKCNLVPKNMKFLVLLICLLKCVISQLTLTVRKVKLYLSIYIRTNSMTRVKPLFIFFYFHSYPNVSITLKMPLKYLISFTLHPNGLLF